MRNSKLKEGQAHLEALRFDGKDMSCIVAQDKKRVCAAVLRLGMKEVRHFYQDAMVRTERLGERQREILKTRKFLFRSL